MHCRSLSGVFTVRRMAEMEDQVRSTVNTYIDNVIETGSAELVADITSPFPMDVICSLLGICEADRTMLRGCADRLLIREDGTMSFPLDAAHQGGTSNVRGRSGTRQ